MQNGNLKTAFARLGALILFFAGLYFLAQAYTMAFHGVYIDCFAGDAKGCALRQYAEPTLVSAFYGTALAVIALFTIYLGVRALRWVQGARK